MNEKQKRWQDILTIVTVISIVTSIWTSIFGIKPILIALCLVYLFMTFDNAVLDRKKQRDKK